MVLVAVVVVVVVMVARGGVWFMVVLVFIECRNQKHASPEFMQQPV